ncbi:MAG TPA: asparagine synthase (glutamine-hydrolyzing) [Vicinamibacterales bacterium]|nr:asparagine synthase (glutamine-hydrolyzing) [Vicinamibacterales bacterium]
MCGIIGVLNLTNRAPIDPDRLGEANGTLRHRGPDDEGVFVQPDFGMAMRRLSIIDVAHGHQPMSNEDGTVHLVYNGEIYNHEELRRELVSFGHRFATRADSEVIVHGYEQWGHDGLLERLRGMFAFAVWNSAEKTLLLARDRMGMKPLYYAEHDGRLYFSSEIRGLLHLSGLPRRANIGAVGVFMKMGYVTSPHTMFEGVHKLPPAHYMRVKHGAVSTHEYWALSYEATHRGSEADIVDEFRERLQDCVTRHMMSEVTLGALLSGGVDSTAIAAFMRNGSKQPFKTVTLAFTDKSFDEMEWAAASARELGTDHHTIEFSGDSMDDYRAALSFLEEPTRAVETGLYRLFRACRELGLKVVLTGEGADELLGGYAWHQGGMVDRALSTLPPTMRRTLGRNKPLRQLGRRARNGVRRMRGLPTAAHIRYREMSRIHGPDIGGTLIAPEVTAAGGRTAEAIFDSWAQWMRTVEGQADYEQILWIQSRTRMPDFVVHGIDRMSMAHSIEARPPFLDHTLWEFCASIPSGFKLRNRTEKYLLREAGRGAIPEAARVRPKKALQVPYAEWVSRRRLPEWAESALSEPRVKRAGLLSPPAVTMLRREVQAGDREKATMLMNVLTLQTWVDMFVGS